MEYPVHRDLITIDGNEQSEGFKFRLMTYNVLAQTGLRRELFAYASQQCLKGPYRKQIILRELAESNADVICLQEIDTIFYRKFYGKELGKMGYDSHFKLKTSDGAAKDENNSYGIAIFWKKAVFEQVSYDELEFDDLAEGLDGIEREELLRSNVGQILALRSLQRPSLGIIVSNYHLFWNPRYQWVRIRQMLMVIQRMQTINSSLNFHAFLLGDLNAGPTSGVYKLMTGRSILPDEYPQYLMPTERTKNIMSIIDHAHQGTLWENTQDISSPSSIQRISELEHAMSIFKQIPSMRSAYENFTKITKCKKHDEYPDDIWEPPYTNYTTWKGTLDYIFHFPIRDGGCVMIRSILDIPGPDVCGAQGGLPSDIFGSDHLSLMADGEFWV
eukprot:TRINITY_DN8627_c0_g1_i1.p1 TRINITY_DN8627_c0_g1~~TRINITY_DN8627_c0_g1_i1.p1  ORF type:complete len:387 (+),score=90.20 TRINITY_DN8627_c0_g1_i1:63-1223(+)